MGLFQGLRIAGRVLRLELSITKRLAVYELLQCLVEKSGQLVRILLPAIVLDQLVYGGGGRGVFFALLLLSLSIACLDFASSKLRDAISAHASKMDNSILLLLNEKKLRVDYKDTILAESMDKEERASAAVPEFLGVDYLVFHEIPGAVYSLLVVGYVVVQLDWLAAVVVLAAAVAHYFLTKWQKGRERRYQSVRVGLSRQRKYLQELLLHPKYGKDIRVYDAGGIVIEKYSALYARLLRMEKAYKKGSFFEKALGQLIDVLQLFVVYVLAIGKYNRGGITIGSFTLYINAAREIAVSVKDLFEAVAELSKTGDYFADYEEYMALGETIVDEARQEESAVAAKARKQPGEGICIEVEHVSFCYPGSSRYVLQDISLTFHENETVSIVGDNGAGKTTLVCLLLRLFDPTEGKIRLDGTDIREIPYSEYIRMVAPVFQDYELFAASFRENIILGDSYDAGRMAESLAFADMDDFAHSLSDGEETVLTRLLDEGGRELSGGEKQKLGIARAAYRRSQVLILDEPTAAIDPLSEHRLYHNIYKRNAGMTIFISHRLTSTMFSDQVIVLDQGRVVQQGTHKELMEIGGIYKEMFEKQAICYVSEKTEYCHP